MLHIKFGFNWACGFRGEDVCRDIEYYGDIHVYCPGVGAYEVLGPICFQNHLYSVLLPISCKIFTSNDFLKVFPIQNALATYVDLVVK